MKGRKNQSFSEDFKREVAMEVIAGKMNKETARRIYGIKGKSAVNDWVRNYSNIENATNANDVLLRAMTPQEREEFEMLKRKIALLEEQLKNETHRSGLYKTMIEIAETQLNIPIRKKYGAKQFIHTKSTPKK